MDARASDAHDQGAPEGLQPVLLHGLSVQPVAPLVASPSSDSVDIVCVQFNGAADDIRLQQPLGATVVARTIELDGSVSMQVVMSNPGALVEWPGFMRAYLTYPTADRRSPLQVTFTSLDVAAESFLDVLTSPAVGAVAAMRGALVLHATTVVVNGVGVALLADRGRGKSSVAALLGTNGVPLLSEDVTAIGRGDEGLVVHSGVHVIRLRTTTPWLAELPGLVRKAEHPDGRVVVCPPVFESPRASVGAVVLVQLSAEAHRVEFASIPPAQAVAVLMAGQRCPFASRSRFIGSTFGVAADLAGAAPIGVLTVPWALDRRNASLGSEMLQVLARIIERGQASR